MRAFLPLTIGVLLFGSAAQAADPAPVPPASIPVASAPAASDPAAVSVPAFVAQYIQIVSKLYTETATSAELLKAAGKEIAATPGKDSLELARKRWLATRSLYVQTEAFRFYDGPIEVFSQDINIEGPERQLDAWPLDAAWLDATKANPQGGLIQSRKPINPVELHDINQRGDDRHVSSGFHAIEFFLWGEDLKADGPGARQAKDFQSDDSAARRRRQYVLYATKMLSEDLNYLKAEWVGGSGNYASRFGATPQQSLGNILTGLATLSGYELADVHLAKALERRDANYEQDQFSDNTVKDLVGMAQGIGNVLTGQYHDLKGPGLIDLVVSKDPGLAQRLAAQHEKVMNAMRAIPEPFDTRVLAADADSDGHARVKDAIAALRAESALIVEAGKALGVEVEVAG